MSEERLNLRVLKTPAILMVAFWTVAIALWQAFGNIFWLFNFAYIGTAVSAGLGLYLVLPKRKKHWGRKIAKLLVGAYMVGYLGLLMGQNMQIEGFFFYLLAGIYTGSVIHYLVAKIAGPLLFGRGWCGWACWTSALLDLLPHKRDMADRPNKKWGWLRCLHFFLSLGLVLILWFGFGYRPGSHTLTPVSWLIGGNALYYSAAILLAYAFKDNRAFCKYLCPIPTLQKIPSRYSLLKIAGDRGKCSGCGVCAKACPMGIDIPGYTQSGRRVLSTECTHCSECVNACAKGALHSSFAWDGRNSLRLNGLDRASSGKAQAAEVAERFRAI
jgi:polyferredoxin